MRIDGQEERWVRLRSGSAAVKKFLNEDLKAQLKAGFRNGDLELTQEGKHVLLELLADTVADKFTASANDKIAEEK